MSDYRQKFKNYKNALNRLGEGISRFDETDDLLRDGLIQRFEFTFELSWKTLKSIFEDEGLNGLNSPKTVLKEAYSAELIEDEELWLKMLKDRNSTTHIYSEKVAIEICNNIINKYYSGFKKLLEQIKTRKFD